MNLSNTGAFAIALVVAIVGVMLFVKEPVAVNVQDGGTAEVVEVGALPGAELNSDFFCVNGACRHYRSAGLTTATSSVICSLRAPAATSTLDMAGVRFNSGTTSAFGIGAWKSLLPASGGTLIATTSVGANTPAMFPVMSTTSAALTTTQLTFQPNMYLLFRVNTTAAGNLSAPGSCSAVFNTF